VLWCGLVVAKILGVSAAAVSDGGCGVPVDGTFGLLRGVSGSRSGYVLVAEMSDPLVFGAIGEVPGDPLVGVGSGRAGSGMMCSIGVGGGNDDILRDRALDVIRIGLARRDRTLGAVAGTGWTIVR